jgi:hypothetical protein
MIMMMIIILPGHLIDFRMAGERKGSAFRVISFPGNTSKP